MDLLRSAAHQALRDWYAKRYFTPILTEKEYRIMSPPRRPRGEKPRTTIRYLQRQIANLQIELNTSRCANDVLKRQIAAQDVELSECAERERILEQHSNAVADSHGMLLASHQRQAIRLSFLEGYYAKSTEANPGASAGNQENLPYGTPHSQEARTQTAPRRPGGGLGGEIRGFSPNNPAYTDGRSLEERALEGVRFTNFEVEIAHDATESEQARYRR